MTVCSNLPPFFRSKSSHVVHFSVKAGDIITWEFATLKRDIGFGKSVSYRNWIKSKVKYITNIIRLFSMTALTTPGLCSPGNTAVRRRAPRSKCCVRSEGGSCCQHFAHTRAPHCKQTPSGTSTPRRGCWVVGWLTLISPAGILFECSVVEERKIEDGEMSDVVSGRGTDVREITVIT